MDDAAYLASKGKAISIYSYLSRGELVRYASGVTAIHHAQQAVRRAGQGPGRVCASAQCIESSRSSVEDGCRWKFRKAGAAQLCGPDGTQLWSLTPAYSNAPPIKIPARLR